MARGSGGVVDPGEARSCSITASLLKGGLSTGGSKVCSPRRHLKIIVTHPVYVPDALRQAPSELTGLSVSNL